jgi:hypothetical protein
MQQLSLQFLLKDLLKYTERRNQNVLASIAFHLTQDWKNKFQGSVGNTLRLYCNTLGVITR